MTDGNNHPSGVTGHVKTLITKSWSNFSSKGDLNELGVPMFTKLFEILPETKAIFHYDENDSNSLTKLRNHIKLLFDTIGMAVDFIDDLGSLTPVIIQLGTRHHFYGVKQEYYLIFGECMLHAFETALGKEFTEEDRAAWMTFYHWIGGCIVKGMSIEAAKT